MRAGNNLFAGLLPLSSTRPSLAASSLSPPHHAPRPQPHLAAPPPPPPPPPAMASFGPNFGSTPLEHDPQDDAWQRSDPLFDRAQHGPQPDDAGDPDRDDALYSVLNLERTASDQDIQRSYRRLAGTSSSHHHSLSTADPPTAPAQPSSTQTATATRPSNPPPTPASPRFSTRTRPSRTRTAAPSMTSSAPRGSAPTGTSRRGARRPKR